VHLNEYFDAISSSARPIKATLPLQLPSKPCFYRRTGTLDSQGLVSAVARDGGQGGMSMAIASIIKKYKRTLVNFQEDFLMPFIKKAAFRYMQFDPSVIPLWT